MKKEQQIIVPVSPSRPLTTELLPIIAAFHTDDCAIAQGEDNCGSAALQRSKPVLVLRIFLCF